ncbi:MAG: hypothetical protein HQM10_00070 [Candidatus Riflebacteria bacterium]|nr:hypothetical protein [Candidatus Riflebacteria bacterium]
MHSSEKLFLVVMFAFVVSAFLAVSAAFGVTEAANDYASLCGEVLRDLKLITEQFSVGKVNDVYKKLTSDKMYQNIQNMLDTVEAKNHPQIATQFLEVFKCIIFDMNPRVRLRADNIKLNQNRIDIMKNILNGEPATLLQISRISPDATRVVSKTSIPTYIDNEGIAGAINGRTGGTLFNKLEELKNDSINGFCKEMTLEKVLKFLDNVTADPGFYTQEDIDHLKNIVRLYKLQAKL